MSVICKPKRLDEFEAMQWLGDNTERFLKWLRTIHPGIKVEQGTSDISIADDLARLSVFESDFIVHNKTKELSYKLTEKQFNEEFDVVMVVIE